MIDPVAHSLAAISLNDRRRVVGPHTQSFLFYCKLQLKYVNYGPCDVVIHVKWVPCHHGMARPQVADGGDGLQIWRVAANIFNKQSRTGDRGWSSSLGVGRGV
jgi:hypothetical protein